jgi:hypothetical protein
LVASSKVTTHMVGTTSWQYIITCHKCLQGRAKPICITNTGHTSPRSFESGPIFWDIRSFQPTTELIAWQTQLYKKMFYKHNIRHKQYISQLHIRHNNNHNRQQYHTISINTLQNSNILLKNFTISLQLTYIHQQMCVILLILEVQKNTSLYLFFYRYFQNNKFSEY